MVVVIANDLPAAVRGRMKLWFIEPRANVFVSGIKDSVAEEVVDYLQKYCPPDSGILIFKSIPRAPGFEFQCIGPLRRQVVRISDLPLIVEVLKS